MDKVIKTLNTIEARATRIMEVTLNEKAALKEEYSKRLSDYETQINADTAKQLELLKQELDMQAQNALATLESETQKELIRLNEYFEENHTRIAEQIFHSIIGE